MRFAFKVNQTFFFFEFKMRFLNIFVTYTHGTFSFTTDLEVCKEKKRFLRILYNVKNIKLHVMHVRIKQLEP